MPNAGNPVSSHERERKRFYPWLFNAGIIFWWLFVWMISTLFDFDVNVARKGHWTYGFSIKEGSVAVDCNTFRVNTTNQFHSRVPDYRSTVARLEQFLKEPFSFLCEFGRLGWRTDRYLETISFPVIGFLWLQLIWGCRDIIKKGRSFHCRTNRITTAKFAILVLMAVMIGERTKCRAESEEICRRLKVVTDFSRFFLLRTTD